MNGAGGSPVSVPRMPKRARADKEPKENKYYSAISRRWRLAKFASLLLLIAFLLAVISFYRSSLTVENLRYLVRYLDKSSPEYTGNYRTIYFDSSNKQQLGVYKGELAVLGENSLTLYNMLGNSTLSYSVSCTTPMLLTSDKYMLVWSVGENSFTVSNAFSKLYSGSCDYAIYGAALSDSGMFAVVSNTMEYRGAVYIYDQNFNLVSRILKDKLVMQVCFNKAGTRAMVLSAYNENGSYVSELMAIDPYSDEPLWTVKLDGSLVCRGAFTSDGGFMVLCDDAMRFYSSSGKEITKYTFTGLVPLTYAFSDSYSVAVFNKNIVGDDNTVVVTDTQGVTIYSATHSGQILDIEVMDDAVYILFDSQVTRINLLTGETTDVGIESGGKSLLLKDSLSLMVCYTHKADTYRIASLFGDETDETDETAAETTTAETTPVETTAVETTTIETTTADTTTVETTVENTSTDETTKETA